MNETDEYEKSRFSYRQSNIDDPFDRSNQNRHDTIEAVTTVSYVKGL